MAHFYAEIKGQRGPGASRLGNKKDGMTAHVRGWDVGVAVEIHQNAAGRDVVTVYRTGGSNNPSKTRVAMFIDDLPTFIEPELLAKAS